MSSEDVSDDLKPHRCLIISSTGVTLSNEIIFRILVAYTVRMCSVMCDAKNVSYVCGSNLSISRVAVSSLRN